MKTMLSFVAFLLIFGLADISSGAAVIDSGSGTISMDIQIPRGQTREQYLQSISDYWTPERMASAQSMDLITLNEDQIPFINNHQEVDEAPQILTPSALLPSNRNAPLPPAVCKVFFVLNGGNYLCSCSVVHANNRDYVVTAGHCVYDSNTKRFATNFIAVPLYTSGQEPYGRWVFRTLATNSAWMSSGQWNADVGTVLVNTNSKGEHIEDVVGGFGILQNPPRTGQVYSFGYPVNMNNGQTMSQCSGTPYSPTYVLGFTGFGLICGMTGGCSGGPWVQQYSTNTNYGMQVSVNSFGISNRPNNLYGPYFTNTNIGAMFNQHQDK